MPPKHPNYSLQTQPKRRWKRIRALKENDGGFNGGINEVEDRDAPGKTYIEKIATREFVENQQIDQEIVILKHLSTPPHPHITEMVDHYVDRMRGAASIYLEHCTEAGLDRVIRRRRATKELINEMDVWQWFIQLFDALTYCHFGPDKDAHLKIIKGKKYKTDWNVVWHRDIKPANILVTKGTRPGQDVGLVFKIGDFGCAVARKHVWHDEKNKRKKNSFRTDGWTPPEAPAYVARSDVWQLGAIIGCLCTLTQIAHHLNPKEPAPGYSKVLNEAIIACMDPNVKTRPSASEVLQFVTKKYAEIRPGLEKNGRPNPHWLHKIEQQQGYRNPAPNPWNNLGPSRLGPAHRGMPGRIPREMHYQAPRGIPGLNPGFRGFECRGFGQYIPRMPYMKPMGGIGPRGMPRRHTEPVMEDSSDDPVPPWENEDIYTGEGYYPGPHMYYGDSQMGRFGCDRWGGYW